MAHLVEIYKGLSKVRKVQPIAASDLPKTILDAYIENTLSYYKKLETRRRQSLPNGVGSVGSPRAPPKTTNQRRIRRRTLATIEEGKPLVGEQFAATNQMPSKKSNKQSEAKNKSQNPNGPMGSATVILQRNSGISSLGLGIAGGADKSFPAIVSVLRPGSIAYRSDGLQVGDVLRAVNGIKLLNLSHNEILSVLRNSGCSVRLDIEYDLNDSCFEKPASTLAKASDIYLEKEDGSFGFTMRGGSYGPDTKKSRPFTVTSIRAGGPADREGRLRVGDRILSIDGIDIFSATHQAATKLLSEASGSVCLAVEYDVSILETVKSANGPLLLEIDKPSGVDLGINLAILDHGIYRRSLFIENILPASIADRCGALHSGDELLGIDEMSLEYTTLAEARQLLRGKPQANQIKLEIIPYSHINDMKRTRIPNSEKPPIGSTFLRNKSSQGSVRRKVQNSKASLNEKAWKSGKKEKQRDRSLESAMQGYQNGYRMVSPASTIQDFRGSAPSLNGKERDHGRMMGNYVTHMETVRTRSRQRMVIRSRNGTRPSNSSLSASVSGVPCGQVCHSEVMEVMLNSWSKGGFGLVLHRGHNTGEHNRAPLFVSYIERGSPAEKSGVLQVGDRIMAINDWCTANGTADEANYVIRHAASPLTLTVEFDVIETVLPTSGVFTVKLAKRGQNLGVVISSSGSGAKGEPVIVSDVRTGSVAHRCGSILPGDQLLAIDNIPLDTCTVEESVRLLHRSSDIVKLRVKKAGSFINEEADSAPQTVVYSVELSRRGGPLGITIASTDDRGDPVIISQLAPGGLAERTGALHVGDRILAINGESLNGKRVSEAMQMLQSAGDSVAVKIARCVDPPYPYQNAVCSSRSQQTQYTGLGNSSLLDHYLSDHDVPEKLGTPVQSIDSAVESLEDSPIAENHHGHPSSNRHSQNSKSSSISGGGSDQSKYVEELSVCLQRSLTTLKNNPTSPAGSSGGQRQSGGGGGDGGSVGTGSSASHTASDHGFDSGLGSSEAGGDHFCHCLCQQQSGAGQAQEEWIRVLEALETVGEEEMLKKLEETIMAGAVPQCDHGTSLSKPSVPSPQQPSTSQASPGKFPLSMPFPVTNTILRHPHMGARNSRTLSESNSSLTSSGSGSGGNPSGPAPVPPPKPPHPIPNASVGSYAGPLKISTVLKSYDSIPFITSPIQKTGNYVKTPSFLTPAETVLGAQLSGTNLPPNNSSEGSSTPSSIQLSAGTATPSIEGQVAETNFPGTSSSSVAESRGSAASSNMPLEIYRVTLFKDRDYNDFGFSVSDGVNRKGVYINKVRSGGPADLSGSVKPFDRILQVNETSLNDLDCTLAVPLLLSSPDRVDLLMCRDFTFSGPNGPQQRPDSIAEEDESQSITTETTVEASV